MSPPGLAVAGGSRLRRSPRPAAPRQPAQHPDRRGRERRVDEGHERVTEWDAGCAGDGLVHPHHAIDDPGLSPHLGGDPPADQRDRRGGPREDGGTMEPRRPGRPRCATRWPGTGTPAASAPSRCRPSPGRRSAPRSPADARRAAPRRAPRPWRWGRGRPGSTAGGGSRCRRRPHRRGTSPAGGWARPRWSSPRPSIAASLVGCASATVRAAQSPTTTCAGAASAAIVNGITSPMRW